MKNKLLLLSILLFSMVFFTCDCDDIFGKDDDPEYPAIDHDNDVIEEVRDELDDGETLTLSSGHSVRYYGDVGPTILQEISLADRDVIPNEYIFWTCCKDGFSSAVVEGPIPSGVSRDSLYAIWYDPSTGNSGVLDNLSATGDYQFIIPGEAAFYEVRWPFFYEVPGLRRTSSDYTIQNVPYYEQYTTSHCWACVTAMLLHYYSPTNPVYEDKMWEVVARNNHYDGYSELSMRYSNSYSNYISGELGVTPRFEIEDWAGSLGEFIECLISDSQYVVGLSSDHMILITGWWMNGFIYNDPKGLAGDIYNHKNWDVYVTDNATACGLFNNNHLVVTVPISTASANPGPTLSIGNPDSIPYGITIDPDTNSHDLDHRADMARLVIDNIYDNSGGVYGLHWAKRSTGVRPKPTIRNDWNLHARVRVYNPASTAQNFLVDAVLQDRSGNNVHTSAAVNVPVAAHNFTEITIDTIPLSVVTEADTHYLIVNLYDETGLAHHYDRLKIHVPIDEMTTPSIINHCEMRYAVWGYYSGGGDYYTSIYANCDVSFDSTSGLYNGTWSETDNVGSITFRILDETQTDSFYYQSSDDRGTHEMVCMYIPYASSSPLGPGPRYYLDSTFVCEHTYLLNVDWTLAGWGVMTSYGCIGSGFYLSHIDIEFSP